MIAKIDPTRFSVDLKKSWSFFPLPLKLSKALFVDEFIPDLKLFSLLQMVTKMLKKFIVPFEISFYRFYFLPFRSLVGELQTVSSVSSVHTYVWFFSILRKWLFANVGRGFESVSTFTSSNVEGFQE